MVKFVGYLRDTVYTVNSCRILARIAPSLAMDDSKEEDKQLGAETVNGTTDYRLYRER